MRKVIGGAAGAAVLHGRHDSPGADAALNFDRVAALRVLDCVYQGLAEGSQQRAQVAFADAVGPGELSNPVSRRSAKMWLRRDLKIQNRVRIRHASFLWFPGCRVSNAKRQRL